MEFNLQTFLSEMRDEQREDHRDLSNKVDNMLETLQDHETRLTVVENSYKSAKWFVALLITGLVTVAGDLLFKLFAKQ